MPVVLGAGGTVIQSTGGAISLSCCLPTPTVEWDSVSASKTKCGWAEWSGYVSSPPKRYLTLTQDGERNQLFTRDCQANALVWDNFAATYSTSTCGISYSGSVLINGNDCGVSVVVFADDEDEGYYAPEDATSDCSVGLLYGADSAVTTVSATVREVSDNRGCGGLVTMTLSSEYTTALLKSNTVAALPAYDGDWNDTAGSYASLSTDELTYNAREGKWRVVVPSSFRSGLRYRFYYTPRFTPASGSPTLGTEAYVELDYDGTQTHLAGLTEAIPTSNGTNDITSTYWTCEGLTP